MLFNKMLYGLLLNLKFKCHLIDFLLKISLSINLGL